MLPDKYDVIFDTEHSVDGPQYRVVDAVVVPDDYWSLADERRHLDLLVKWLRQRRVRVTAARVVGEKMWSASRNADDLPNMEFRARLHVQLSSIASADLMSTVREMTAQRMKSVHLVVERKRAK